MDELEINGKKYLSSRKAAKEHNYHTDYIGQLIRAGKIVGKKVGRSWYVEEKSLKNYLLSENNQSASQPEPAIEKATKAESPIEEIEQEPEALEPAPEPQPVVPEIIEVEKKPAEHVVMFESIKTMEQPQERQVQFSTPAPKKTLTYVQDDEPMLPVLNGRPNADFVAVPMRKISNAPVRSIAEGAPDEPVVEVFEKPKRKMPSAKRFATLAAFAAVVVGVVAVGTSLLATSIKVNEGQAASVGITIK